MATYTSTGDQTFSGSGSQIKHFAFADLNEIFSDEIPKYSTINSVSLKVYVRETTNKVGDADFYVFFGDNSNNSKYQLYYGNGKIPKNDKSDLEVLLDLTEWTASNTSNAGHISYNGATRLCFRCQSALINRSYRLRVEYTLDFTRPTYTIKTIAGTGGNVTPTATHDVILSNKTKTITATPTEGYKFVKWVDSNGKTYTDSTISVTFSHNTISAHSTTVTYTAHFEPITHTVTTKVSPSGSGTVTGGGSYNDGSTATLTAKPAAGYKFVKWNDGVTTSSRTITVTGDATYTAYFEKIKVTATFVNHDNTPLQTVSVDYGTTPSYTGSTPTKSSTAEYSYSFSGWSPALGNITTATTYTAQFTATKRKYTLTVTAGTGGTVSGSGTYEYGKTVTLTATPATGYRFVKWNDGVTTASRTVTVTGAATYTATFELDKINKIYVDTTQPKGIYVDETNKKIVFVINGTVSTPNSSAFDTLDGYHIVVQNTVPSGMDEIKEVYVDTTKVYG